MKLIDLKCSACGATMKVNSDLKKVTCTFCGKEMLIDDEVTKLHILNGFEYGYDQERGRLKAQEDYQREQKEKQINLEKKKREYEEKLKLDQEAEKERQRKEELRNLAEQYSSKSTLLGILSIIVGTLGGIFFGVIGGVAGLFLACISISQGIKARKLDYSNNRSFFTIGLIGLSISIFFTIGCIACGMYSDKNGSSSKYGCTGCIGASCQAKKDVNDLGDAWEKAWEDALKDVDWDNLK